MCSHYCKPTPKDAWRYRHGPELSEEEDRTTLHQDTPSLDIPGLSLLRSGVGIQSHTSRPQFPQMPR